MLIISSYKNQSAELSRWLQSAVARLEFWTTQSVTVPQELETVRDHLCAFLVSLVVKSALKLYIRHHITDSIKNIFVAGIFKRGRCQIILALFRAKHRQPATAAEKGRHSWSQDSNGPD